MLVYINFNFAFYIFDIHFSRFGFFALRLCVCAVCNEHIWVCVRVASAILSISRNLLILYANDHETYYYTQQRFRIEHVSHAARALHGSVGISFRLFIYLTDNCGYYFHICINMHFSILNIRLQSQQNDVNRRVYEWLRVAEKHLILLMVGLCLFHCCICIQMMSQLSTTRWRRNERNEQNEANPPSAKCRR